MATPQIGPDPTHFSSVAARFPGIAHKMFELMSIRCIDVEGTVD